MELFQLEYTIEELLKNPPNSFIKMGVFFKTV